MTPIIPNKKVRFVFFGTPLFASIILDELESAGFLPSLIVSAPDKPRGRKLLLSPSEVKEWGEKRNIPVITPTTLKDIEIVERLKQESAQLFIVAAYGKLIPKTVIDIPEFGVLNVHPSLLPKFRGASPIESAILSDEKITGVTIMVVDEEMDHGPIVTQREYITNNWPPRASELTKDLAHFGGNLLAEIIPKWLNGLAALPQDHSHATFTTKIAKEDGLIDLKGDPLLNYKKIKAFDEWPGAYFFTERNGKTIRVRIADATYENKTLTLLRVIPEGKKEMDYKDFMRGAH